LTAKAAIDEDAKLYLGGSAKIQQGVQGCPDGATGVEDIVDEDDILILYGERDVCLI